MKDGSSAGRAGTKQPTWYSDGCRDAAVQWDVQHDLLVSDDAHPHTVRPCKGYRRRTLLLLAGRAHLFWLSHLNLADLNWLICRPQLILSPAMQQHHENGVCRRVVLRAVELEGEEHDRKS